MRVGLSDPPARLGVWGSRPAELAEDAVGEQAAASDRTTCSMVGGETYENIVMIRLLLYGGRIRRNHSKNLIFHPSEPEEVSATNRPLDASNLAETDTYPGM